MDRQLRGLHTFPLMAEHIALAPSYAVLLHRRAHSLLFSMLFVKETKGKTLEQMV